MDKFGQVCTCYLEGSLGNSILTSTQHRELDAGDSSAGNEDEEEDKISFSRISAGDVRRAARMPGTPTPWASPLNSIDSSMPSLNVGGLGTSLLAFL